MNKNKFGLIHLMAVSTKENILNHIFAKEKTVPPLRIGKYRYVRKLTKQSNSDEVVVCLYEDMMGSKVVVKMWKNQFKTYSYYSIKNEYRVHKLLLDVRKRIFNRIPANLQNVRIPRILQYIESKHCLIIITEWIDGKTAEKYSNTKSLESYFRASDFLDFLYQRMSHEEIEQLTKRTGFQYIALYPFLFVVVYLRYKDLRKILKSSFFHVLKTSFSLIKDHNYSLIHRDLHFKNLLIKKNAIYIIDFQLTSISLKNCEYVNTLRYCWDKKYLKNIFYQKIVTTKIISEASRANFKTLAIAFATHGLIANNFSKHTISQLKKFLVFSNTI